MTRLALAAALVLSGTAAQAFDGFCGTYVQTSSNAGDCPACRLIVADNPTAQFYFVEANNGWTAELTWVDGDESVASGEGVWGDVGGGFSNQAFDIDLSAQGQELFLLMTHHAPELGGTIEATFRCTD